MSDVTRERAAVHTVACPHCQAPAGHHCANLSSTIVWPPHLCRMDAYTHRLHPSEDWPIQLATPPEQLDYVASVPASPVLWKDMVQRQLVTTIIHEE